MNRTRSIAMAIVMSVFLPQFANAQTGTGAVRGQVVDSQSRAIVGARVALTDENNRLVRTQLTGGLGEFTFVGLPPATYRIDCEAVGFKKLTIEHVAAAVDSTVEVRWPPGPRQTVKTQFAVGWKSLDRQIFS
jgi:hypothetical protein